MLTFKQYFDASNKINESYDDDYYDDDYEDDFSLSMHDRQLFNRYCTKYKKLIDTIAQINKLSQKLDDQQLDKDPKAIALGKQCTKLIGEMGKIAGQFVRDPVGEYLYDILCVADELYTQYPQPSNFIDSGEFTVNTIADLNRVIDQYEQTGEIDEF